MSTTSHAGKWLMGLAAAVTLLVGAPSARAVVYGFDAITQNDGLGANSSVGQSQFQVDVTQQGSDQVLFTFSNSGPSDSSITHVYFSDAGMVRLFSIADINNTAGVAFSNPADPQDLPGGSSLVPPFETTFRNDVYFSAESTPDAVANGINPGESLGVSFTLDSVATFADVLLGLDGGSLRVGIVGAGFPPSQDIQLTDLHPDWEAFINGPPVVSSDIAAVAAPDMAMTVVLLGCAILALEGVRRIVAR